MSEAGPNITSWRDGEQLVRKGAYSLSKQFASLILRAFAFTVALSWNQTVQALIALWLPKQKDGQEKHKALKYQTTATVITTLLAVALTAIMTWIFGSSVRTNGQAGYYLGTA